VQPLLIIALDRTQYNSFALEDRWISIISH